MPMQHRQQHRQPVAFHAHRHATRIRQRRGIHQCLHFHQQRPGALAGDHHATAGLWRAGAREEDRRGVRHLAQALVAHREHAELVDRAEAVLEGAQHAEARTGIALEIQHGIHHVLQHARTGDAAFLGDMPDQEHRGAGFLGIAHQPRRGLAHLADRTRCRAQRVRPQGLDGIGDDQFRLRRERMLEDALDAGFGQRLHAVERQAQALPAPGHLREGFLAGHVQARQFRRHQRQRLQQQRRLADAGIAADQHHRAFGQAAAEHAVEFADAGGHPRLRVRAHVRQRRHFRRIHLARPAAAPRRRRCRLRRAFQHDLAQRIPCTAGIALALPLGVVGAAFAADVGGPAFRRGCAGCGLGHAAS